MFETVYVVRLLGTLEYYDRMQLKTWYTYTTMCTFLNCPTFFSFSTLFYRKLRKPK